MAGEMVIAKEKTGSREVLTQQLIEQPVPDAGAMISFANVDHKLIFKFGDEELTYDLGYGPEDAGQRTDTEPQVSILGAGEWTLSHVAIFRDTHYIELNGNGPGWAGEGHPFTLGKGEYFMLGDNSPASKDSRLWSEVGPHLHNRQDYQLGTVTEDQLIGKAFFVYWPMGYRIDWLPVLRHVGVVPCVGKMRWIR